MTADLAQRIRAWANGEVDDPPQWRDVLREAADALDGFAKNVRSANEDWGQAEQRIKELEAERDAIGRLIRGETDLLSLDTPLLKTFAELICGSDESLARLAAAERVVEAARELVRLDVGRQYKSVSDALTACAAALGIYDRQNLNSEKQRED